MSLPCLKLSDMLPPIISIKSNRVSGLACAYLSDFISHHSLPPPLHSSHTGFLSVPPLLSAQTALLPELGMASFSEESPTAV